MRIVASLLVAFVAACDNSSGVACCDDNAAAIKVVNGFTAPVDVVLDGKVAIAAVSPGTVVTVPASAGRHDLALRAGGSATTGARAVTVATGGVAAVAAVVAGSSLGAALLDDTNSVVPAGATKVRVLHLAPRAGTLQVYRTQPDFQQPVSWAFPFTYQADPTPISAPFYQSTPGAWEIRVWQTPAIASGWDSAPARVTIPLASGEKKTVVILDAPGGGVRLELL